MIFGLCALPSRHANVVDSESKPCGDSLPGVAAGISRPARHIEDVVKLFRRPEKRRVSGALPGSVQSSGLKARSS